MSVIFDPEPKQLYPRDDEVEMSEDCCSNCEHQYFTTVCSACGGEGGHDGYEEDPLWYDEGDIIPCDACRGNGCHKWCPRCGWDALLPEKWNTAWHRGVALVALKKEVSGE